MITSRHCRSAIRIIDAPDYRRDFLGFRLAARIDLPRSTLASRGLSFDGKSVVAALDPARWIEPPSALAEPSGTRITRGRPVPPRRADEERQMRSAAGR